jgi:hypothetical protein
VQRIRSTSRVHLVEIAYFVEIAHLAGMPKLKMRKGVLVILRQDKSNDGKIVGTEGRASWSVTWNLGPLAGKTTKQSSKSLT